MLGLKIIVFSCGGDPGCLKNLKNYYFWLKDLLRLNAFLSCSTLANVLLLQISRKWKVFKSFLLGFEMVIFVCMHSRSVTLFLRHPCLPWNLYRHKPKTSKECFVSIILYPFLFSVCLPKHFTLTLLGRARNIYQVVAENRISGKNKAKIELVRVKVITLATVGASFFPYFCWSHVSAHKFMAGFR